MKLLLSNDLNTGLPVEEGYTEGGAMLDCDINFYVAEINNKFVIKGSIVGKLVVSLYADEVSRFTPSDGETEYDDKDAKYDIDEFNVIFHARQSELSDPFVFTSFDVEGDVNIINIYTD